VDRIEKIKEFLAKSPGDSFLQHALALEYIKLGNDAEAKRLFENIVEKEPAYIGSYYHLGRLHERAGNTEGAIKVYKKGMEEAKKTGENHAYSELRGAYEELSI
jgi:Tfp pilus assembly protein PilF